MGSITRALGAVAVAVFGVMLFISIAGWWVAREDARLLAKVPPFEVSLDAIVPVNWRDPAGVESVTRLLHELGYETTGDYTVVELSFITMRGFCHTNDNTMAVVYETPQVPYVVVEQIALFEDETSVAAGNAPLNGLIDPDYATIHRRHQDVLREPALLASFQQTLLTHSNNAPRLAVTNHQQFATEFIKGWAKEMRWRMTNGGPSAQEFRLIAKNAGLSEPSEQLIRTVQETWLDAWQKHASKTNSPSL